MSQSSNRQSTNFDISGRILLLLARTMLIIRQLKNDKHNNIKDNYAF